MQFTPSKILLTLMTLIFLQTGLSQSPTSYFDDNNPNIKYLEHLIKKGVDEVRENLGLKPLVNDSILYLTAVDQSQFLKGFGRLTHYQTQNQSKRTPQLRADFYGAKNYNVGENIALTSYGTSATTSTGEEISTKTYGGIAKSLVTGWVNSPGHYANIITPEYEVTGLSVSIDKEKGIVYACQNFAHVELRFVFEESKSLFPYSNYIPPPQISSFNKVPNQLIPKYKYPYKLRHDKLEKCASCPDKYTSSPDISLNYDVQRGFTLRIENSEYAKQLIRNKNDGFAVEIVDYEDYACGSPFYYEKPSRRNGQLRLSGKTLEPKYRKELFKGYKKRKKKESVKFFPYIFRKDSVNFFRRFGQYRTDKYTSEYFEIRLGKLPKHGPRLFNYNLIVIKDKQVCDVYYFTQYCGDVYEDYMEPDFIPYQYDDFKYGFQLKPDELSFSIPFDQGQNIFEKEAILKNISSLSEYDFFIDSVKIHAFSSVEGDSAINARLQIKRAESIAEIFQGIQDKEIEKSITTSINWKDFRKEIARNKETRSLGQLSNKDLLEEVNRNQRKLEPQLARTRRGDVQVFFHVIPNLKSLKYYIKSESASLNSDIKFKLKNQENYEYEVDQMADLYRYTYSMIKQGYLDPSFLLEIKIPIVKNVNPRLVQYYLLFGFEYPTIFSKLKEWEKDSIIYIKDYKIATNIEFIPEFNYLLIKLISDDLIESKTLSEKQYKALKSRVNYLKTYYESFELARVNMDKINFNLNMLALNYYFKSEPEGQQENAVMSISQVYEYYVNNGLLFDTLALNIARMAIFYQNPQLGVNFILPYESKSQKIQAFVDEIGYVHPSAPSAPFYYQKLINDSRELPPDVWCNMFIKPCGIPFQAFDYEPLRNRYCELCVGKNDYLNKIYLGEE